MIRQVRCAAGWFKSLRDRYLWAKVTIKDEKTFSDEELKDIMNEFEQVRRDFEEDRSERKLEVQEHIEPEGELRFRYDEDEAQDEADDQGVGARAKKMTSSSMAKEDVNNLDNPSVSMSLDFPIGDKVAKISINPQSGFSLHLAGVELSLDGENGCALSLPGGGVFSVPISYEQKLKKSA